MTQKSKKRRYVQTVWNKPTERLPENLEQVWFVPVAPEYPTRLLGEFWHGGEGGGAFHNEYEGVFSPNDVAWWTPLIEPSPPPTMGMTLEDLF